MFDHSLKTSFRIWLIAVGGDPPPSALAVLDEAERNRSERFLHAADRGAFVTAHVALRCVLGATIGAAPASIRFVVSPSGKPLLAGIHGRNDIEFSLAHTAGYAAVALARGNAIGIDIERRRQVLEYLRIANAVFNPSTANELARFPDPQQYNAFLELWTAAEAYAKATGLGLAGTERRSPVFIAADGRPALGKQPPRYDSFRLCRMVTPADCVGSIVVSGVDGQELRDCQPEVCTVATLWAGGSNWIENDVGKAVTAGQGT